LGTDRVLVGAGGCDRRAAHVCAARGSALVENPEIAARFSITQCPYQALKNFYQISYQPI
jgi:hypothetical protein